MARHETLSTELMEETVNALCESLENDPDRWDVGIHTVDDRQTGIEYWTSMRGQITHVFYGRDTHRVFSDGQGFRLWKSYEKLRQIKADSAQQRIINSLKKEPKDEPITLSSLFRRFFSWMH